MLVDMPTFRESAVARCFRCYPFLSGVATIANRPIVHSLAGHPTNTVWARTAGGMMIAAPLDDYVGRAAFYMGDIDRKLSRVCRWLVRPRDTVVDIGANIGLVTFLMATLAGSNGKVHSFEPNPSRQELLRSSIAKNKADNITLYPMALGDEEGRLQLCIPGDNAGQASFVHHAEARRVEVPVRTLSNVFTETNPGPIRLIKIDVEGFEPQVLKGASKYLAAQPADAIIFEINEHLGHRGDHPALRVLRELGYAFFSFPKALFRLRLAPFDPNGTRALESHDLLAVHRGAAFDAIVARITA